MSSDENTMNDGTAQAGPGGQLRIARESRQISLEEISSRTHISVSRLQALEDNRFDVLGPEPFVIGYIRKFAKILDIDSDALVEDYKRLSGTNSQSPASSSEPITGPAAGPGLATIARRNITATIRQIPGWWVVGGLVAIWIVGAYLIVPDENENYPDRSSMEQPEQVEHEAPPSSAGDEPAGFKRADPEPVEHKPAAEERAAQDPNSISSQSDGTFAAEPESAAERPEVSAGNPVPIEQSSPPVEATADPSRAVELSAAGGDQDGQDLLVMNFVAECWVEVNDANGENIFAALQTPADTLQLFGQAPFTVMLGNARAVSMAINGRAVDTEPRPGRDTLRLTVLP